VTIVPGSHFGAFTVVSIDAIGKRAVVTCRCGGTHVYSVESLRNGTAVCHAAGPTPAQRAALRIEAAARQREHRWK
jgi:hypothetical protein